MIVKGTTQHPDEWYRWPVLTFIPCVFGCGGTENWEDVVHAGLSADVEAELIRMLGTQRDACIAQVLLPLFECLIIIIIRIFDH